MFFISKYLISYFLYLQKCLCFHPPFLHANSIIYVILEPVYVDSFFLGYAHYFYCFVACLVIFYWMLDIDPLCY